MRIREDGDRAFVTYKGKKIDDPKSKTRKEINAEIVNVKEMSEILHQLGFKLVLIIPKERKIYRLENTTFCLDSVESLGDFLEIETIVESKEKIVSTQEKMIKLLDSLGIDHEKTTRKSYFELLLEKRSVGSESKKR